MTSDAASFATTHWSVVLGADRSGDSRAARALERLCCDYWPPLYAHARCRGYSPEDAQDLTQEFFHRLLEKHWLREADQRRGRFRCFLLAAFNHFLANEWDRSHALKRGGDQTLLPFDTVAAEQLCQVEAGGGLNAEELYERNWALRLLAQVRNRLLAEYRSAGTEDRFELLEQFLPGEDASPTYAQAAAQLGVPEGTLKSDVHRLKQRYGQLLREEVAHTVSGPEEVDDELRHLMAVLAR
jgi:DNA-directed RNA polymerase specialized sigma24 family protein